MNDTNAWDSVRRTGTPARWNVRRALGSIPTGSGIVPGGVRGDQTTIAEARSRRAPSICCVVLLVGAPGRLGNSTGCDAGAFGCELELPPADGSERQVRLPGIFARPVFCAVCGRMRVLFRHGFARGKQFSSNGFSMPEDGCCESGLTGRARRTAWSC